MPEDRSSQGTDNNIWDDILNDVSSHAIKRLPQNKQVIILGNDFSGKKSLVSKLKGPGNESITKNGSGLDYDFLDVHDEQIDESTRLSTWVLEGDLNYAKLLGNLITADNISDTLILISVDISRPWSILESLENWTRTIREHINSLHLSAKHLNEMEATIQKQYLSYVDPDDPDSNSLTSKADDTDEETKKDSLGENALMNNTGIPIIVVVTKTDRMVTLQSEMDFNEELFDFIQKNIRSFCLRYGAALMYTSVKENHNIGLLYKYLVHRIYGFPFRSPAQVVDKDSIFIPMGWDNDKKIAILNDHIKTIDSSGIYEDFVKKPLSRKALSQEKEVKAEDEQVFLEKELQNLNKAPAPSTGTSQRSADHQKPTRAPALSPGQRAATARPGGTAKAALPNNAQNAEQGVLANFFNSLLQKQPGGAPRPKASAGQAAANGVVPPTKQEMAAELEKIKQPSNSNHVKSEASVKTEPSS